MKKKVILILDIDDSCDEPHKMWTAEEEYLEEEVMKLDMVERVELTVVPNHIDSVELHF